MVIYKTLHRQLVVALMAASVFVLTLSAAADHRRFPRDELINRPDGTFACLPGEPMCDSRM